MALPVQLHFARKFLTHSSSETASPPRPSSRKALARSSGVFSTSGCNGPSAHSRIAKVRGYSGSAFSGCPWNMGTRGRFTKLNAMSDDRNQEFLFMVRDLVTARALPGHVGGTRNGESPGYSGWRRHRHEIRRARFGKSTAAAMTPAPSPHTSLCRHRPAPVERGVPTHVGRSSRTSLLHAPP